MRNGAGSVRAGACDLRGRFAGRRESARRTAPRLPGLFWQVIWPL